MKVPSLPNRDAERSERAWRRDVHDRRTRCAQRRLCGHPIDPVTAVGSDEARRSHHGASGGDPRQLRDFSKQVVEESAAVAPVRQAWCSRRLHDEHLVRLEPERGMLERDEAFDQQRPRDDKDQRQRDLRNDERLAGPAARTTGDAADRMAERPADIEARGLERRRQAEQNAHEHAQPEREREDGAVNRDLVETRHIVRRERNQRPRAIDRNQHADSAGDKRLNEGLDEQLPDNPGAARSQRGAHRDFRCACRRFGQQQRRHRRTRKQQVQHGRGVADHLALERRHQHPHVPVGVGKLRFEPCGYRGHFRLCLRDGCVGLQSCHGPIVVPAPLRRARIAAGPVNWKPDVGVCRECERRRQDADDGDRPIDHPQRPANGMRRVAEPLPRIAIADHRGPRATLARLVARERSPHRRLHAEDAEELGCHAGEDAVLGRGGTDHDGCPRGRVVRHRVERGALSLPVQEIRRGHLSEPVAGGSATGGEVGQRDDSVRIRVGQRVEHHGMHDAEHRCVRADRERHDEDAEPGRAAGPAQRPDGVAQVLQSGLEQRDAAAIAVGFLYGLEATECDEGLATGLAGRHPGAQVVVDLQLQMALELVAELLIAPSLVERPQEAHQQGADPPHDDSPGARKRATIAVVCCQSRLARSSCLRPARVSL